MVHVGIIQGQIVRGYYILSPMWLRTSYEIIFLRPTINSNDLLTVFAVVLCGTVGHFFQPLNFNY
jgi:hypothetical protein